MPVKISPRQTYLRFCLIAFIALPAQPGLADRQSLLDTYKSLQTELKNNSYGMPVYVKSSDENNIMRGVIYGVIQHPYRSVQRTLASPANWCDIAPLHLNIKACTYHPVNQHCQLTFYSGRKFYEKADDVYQLSYRSVLSAKDKDFIHLSMRAAEGPAGTSDYQLDIKAIPLNKTSSFIYFSYSYHYGFIARAGMSAYLATLGRGKVGFTVTGRNKRGDPIFIEGVRGIIERNAIRYYLAIVSYLDTLELHPARRFESRVNHWFELSERHNRQLYEMEQAVYLQYKQQEHQDQQRLQAALGKSSANDNPCLDPKPGVN